MVLPMHKYMDAYSLKHNAASKHNCVSKNSACYKEFLPRNLQQYVECRRIFRESEMVNTNLKRTSAMKTAVRWVANATTQK